MLTCKEVSKFVSESLEHPLLFRQRITTLPVAALIGVLCWILLSE